jgi:DNA-binding transcriptional LysR family regulator
VRTLLETGKLKRVLVGFEPAPLPIHMLYPSARRLSSNVRALVDWAVPRLRARVPA